MQHLFVTQDFGPDLGGMARRHVELCRRFATEGVTVSTVASRNGGAFDAGEPYAIHRQPFPFDHAKRFVNQIRWARSLAAECAAGVRVIHCGNIRPTGYAVILARLASRRPYVLYVNGGDLLRERDVKSRSAVKRGVTRHLFARASGIVANSSWTAALAQEVMEVVGVAERPPVAAIDLGTDPAQFAPSRDRGRIRQRFALGTAPLILTAARLVPHKGQDVGLRAVQRLVPEFPTMRYLVVGEGPDAQRLRQLAGDLGVSDNVVLAGTLSDEDLADAYATSSVYLGVSRVDNGVNVEGFGIAFVEAAASGVPSVAGDSGGVRSAVRDGETGFMVPPTDLDAVTSALRTLLGNAELRRQMGQNARRAVESHFNWDRVARETLAFTRQVAGA